MKFSDVHNTIGKHMLADGMSPVIDLENSHGSWLVDGKTGGEYLDLFSMFASLSIGYNHPYVIENKERLLNSAINKPTNSDIYSISMAEFVETMGRVAQPDYLPYSFYVSGGALAVENALKAVFDWKVRKNIEKGNGQLGSKVLHFEKCFHGRSGYTLSLTDSPDPRKVKYFPKFDWPRVSTPNIIFPLDEKNLEDVIKRENISIRQIKEAIQKNPHDIACMIIEPIQGEGGDNHFRPEFLIKLKEICLENDILLIFDEVQTGVGITGEMWAHQHLCKINCDCGSTINCQPMEPDIISFGKKTQCCGIFAGKRLDEVENNVFHESSRINSTWGGNLVDMVRFTIYLEIIEQENLVKKAKDSGDYLLDHLMTLQNDYPDLVSNSRGKGLFCAFDLPNSGARDELATVLMDNKVIVLGSGDRSIRFRPHLNIKTEEIDTGISAIRKSLNKIKIDN
ncbi:MAG: L-lysine 6-transaminase [Candidatus Marinimicrobia bacterium]|nr:L-lysine 6-transaminase [Candidatus Neomarinimicrobiota bacterium]